MNDIYMLATGGVMVLLLIVNLMVMIGIKKSISINKDLIRKLSKISSNNNSKILSSINDLSKEVKSLDVHTSISEVEDYYATAKILAEKGASVEEIVATTGISNTEAEYIVRNLND